MIQSFKSKAVRRYWEHSETAGLRADWIGKIELLLDALNNAESPEALKVVGTGFHPLIGDRRVTYSLVVSRNWRMTFCWSEQGAIDVELEDYHGR